MSTAKPAPSYRVAWPLLAGCASLALIAAAGSYFFLVPLLVFSGYFDDPADGFRDASDAQLVADFHAHRTEIERLREMFAADRAIGTIGTDNIGRWWRHDGRWTHSGEQREVSDRADMLRAVGLSAARDEEYQRLFAATGVYRVRACDAAYEGYDVEVCLTRRGNVVHSVNKSFVYAPGTPPKSFGPLPGSRDEERFTALGHGWYLRYVKT